MPMMGFYYAIICCFSEDLLCIIDMFIRICNNF